MPLSAKINIGLGGYVPFGLTSQQETDGSRNTFNFNPMLQFSIPIHLGGSHFFLPRAAGVYHLGTGENYNKTTLIFSLDYALMLSERFLLHAGLNTIMTRLSGDGGAVTVNNGSGYAIAYQPGDTITSYNTAINLGAELVVTPSWSLEFELYTFGILSSTKRDFSYSLVANIFI